MPLSMNPKVRLLMGGGILLVLGLVAHQAGLVEQFGDRESVRALIDEVGPWGMPFFIAVFALGELAHLPGAVFVFAGVAIWGKFLGFLAGMAGAAASVSLGFIVARGIGGQALAQMPSPRVRRILGRLDDRPVQTVLVLRSLFFLAPALNYALGMTTIRFRDYFLGSVLGLTIPLLLFSLFSEGLITAMD